MFKKILSLALAIIMMLSVAMIAASAAQVEVVEDAADTAVEVGAEPEAETGAGNTISFDANTAPWGAFSYVAFHIWAIDDDNFVGFDWGAKKQRGTDADGDNVWTYDLDAAGLSLDSGCQYCVIFYNDNGMQTYNLLFDTSCIGDTATCSSEPIENPEDSEKTCTAAYWKNADASVNGPEFKITSIGNVVGSAIPKSTSKYTMMVKFLALGDKTGLYNAVSKSGKTAQTLIDEIGTALSLKKGDVKSAIKEAAETGFNGETRDWSKDWDESKSTLSDGESSDAHNTGNGGTDNSSSNNSSNSNSSSSSKTNNSTSKTGQETTVVFVMLGVMVAAAGVIFFARKRERA